MSLLSDPHQTKQPHKVLEPNDGVRGVDPLCLKPSESLCSMYKIFVPNEICEMRDVKLCSGALCCAPSLFPPQRFAILWDIDASTRQFTLCLDYIILPKRGTRPNSITSIYYDTASTKKLFSVDLEIRCPNSQGTEPHPINSVGLAYYGFSLVIISDGSIRV